MKAIHKIKERKLINKFSIPTYGIKFQNLEMSKRLTIEFNIYISSSLK